MDALSLTASVLQITTVCVKAAKTLSDINRAWKRAPITVATLANSLKLTSTSLSQIQCLLLENGNSINAKPDIAQTFDTTLTACKAITVWLEKIMTTVTANILSVEHQTWQARFKIIWNETEIGELLSQLKDQQQAAHLLIGLLQMGSLIKIQNMIRSHQTLLSQIKADTAALRATRAPEAPESIFSTETSGTSILDQLAPPSPRPMRTALHQTFETAVLSSNVYKKTFERNLAPIADYQSIDDHKVDIVGVGHMRTNVQVQRQSTSPLRRRISTLISQQEALVDRERLPQPSISDAVQFPEEPGMRGGSGSSVRVQSTPRHFKGILHNGLPNIRTGCNDFRPSNQEDLSEVGSSLVKPVASLFARIGEIVDLPYVHAIALQEWIPTSPGEINFECGNLIMNIERITPSAWTAQWLGLDDTLCQVLDGLKVKNNFKRSLPRPTAQRGTFHDDLAWFMYPLRMALVTHANINILDGRDGLLRMIRDSVVTVTMITHSPWWYGSSGGSTGFFHFDCVSISPIERTVVDHILRHFRKDASCEFYSERKMDLDVAKCITLTKEVSKDGLLATIEAHVNSMYRQCASLSELEAVGAKLDKTHLDYLLAPDFKGLARHYSLSTSTSQTTFNMVTADLTLPESTLPRVNESEEPETHDSALPPTSSLRIIRDEEDAVDRCPLCSWELENLSCQQCGLSFDENGELIWTSIDNAFVEIYGADESTASEENLNTEISVRDASFPYALTRGA